MRPPPDCRPAVGALGPPEARVFGQAPAADEPRGPPRSIIPTGRRVESFADDLNTRRGIVSGRVALLPRSTEIQPCVASVRPSPLSSPNPSFKISSKLFAPFRLEANPPMPARSHVPMGGFCLALRCMPWPWLRAMGGCLGLGNVPIGSVPLGPWQRAHGALAACLLPMEAALALAACPWGLP